VLRRERLARSQHGRQLCFDGGEEPPAIDRERVGLVKQRLPVRFLFRPRNSRGAPVVAIDRFVFGAVEVSGELDRTPMGTLDQRGRGARRSSLGATGNRQPRA
jgi:hypothetical protein